MFTYEILKMFTYVLLSKVAFSQEGSRKYTLFQVFIDFFFQIFGGAFDWLKVEI